MVWWSAVAAVWLGVVGTRESAAQARLPSDGGFTTSLGQPGRWLWTFGVSTGIGRRDGYGSGLGEGRAGVYHELLNPVLGVGGLQLESYNGAFDTRYNGGLRLRFVSPLTGVAAGADVTMRSTAMLRPIFTYVYPLRRSGVAGDGSMVRFDVIGGRNHALMIGVEKPVFRRIPLGTTRPRTRPREVALAPPSSHHARGPERGAARSARDRARRSVGDRSPHGPAARPYRARGSAEQCPGALPGSMR